MSGPARRRIAVLPGDGIGPEVVEQALLTLDALGLGLDFDVLEHVNAETFLATGTALTDADLARVADADAALLGAVGDPRVRTPAYGRQVLLRLRFDLDLYINYRPAQLLHDRLSPLRDADRRAIDCVVVRENTEGLYVGVGGTLRAGTPHETAMDTEVSTYHGVSRTLAFALRSATRAVCMVDKSNAVPSGGTLWQRCWREATARHPGLTTSHLYVDAAVMRLVQDPTAFEVIVTNNSYGDILSDLTAELAGGIGTSASMNLNPETGFALGEPVHGSAPELAGTGAANPVAAILTGGLLLEQLGHRPAAAALREAVTRTVTLGRCTPDLGGSLSTKEVGDAVRREL